MLELQAVSKSYGKREILSGIDHQFPPGVTLLAGPSGSGKSTLLRLCASIEKPSSGVLSWHGKSYSKAKRALRSELGYAPQIVDLPLDVTGIEFLIYIAALKGVRKGAKKQAFEFLEQLGLGADADQRIVGWSGGMRRRLILAQALLGSPKLLALDEPTAELDKETAKRVTALIEHAAQTATVLLTTHMTEHFESIGAVTLHLTDNQLSRL